MRLTPYIAIFFFLCQSIYAQHPKSIILEGNVQLGYPKWPIRFNQFESIGVQDGNLKIERKTNDGFSIIFPSIEEVPTDYSIDCTIEISSSKSNGSAGLIFYGQKSDFSGYFIEFTNKRQFRIYKLYSDQVNYLSGNVENNGWVKQKAISKNKNHVIASISNNILSLIVNDYHILSVDVFDSKSGFPGFFSGANATLYVSSLSIQNLILSKTTNTSSSIEKKASSENKDSEKLDKIIEVIPDDNEKISTEHNQDIYKELFHTIKIRAERQQVRISELQKELDRCNAIIDLSAREDKELNELQLSNLELQKKVESISSELEQFKKRNKYLESILKEYQTRDDGDLLLNLTELITTLREELTELKIENKEKKVEIEKLNTDKRLLITEISRLRKK